TDTRPLPRESAPVPARHRPARGVLVSSPMRCSASGRRRSGTDRGSTAAPQRGPAPTRGSAPRWSATGGRSRRLPGSFVVVDLLDKGGDEAGCVDRAPAGEQVVAGAGVV